MDLAAEIPENSRIEKIQKFMKADIRKGLFIMMADKAIDQGRPFDWGKVSEDYARFRDIYPKEFYERIMERNMCVKGQRVLDLGTGTGFTRRSILLSDTFASSATPIPRKSKLNAIGCPWKFPPRGEGKEEIFQKVKEAFQDQAGEREELIKDTGEKLQNTFNFLELAFQEGQELVVFVTELNTNPYSMEFISENGCDSYYKYNKKLLFDQEQREILEELENIEEEL